MRMLGLLVGVGLLLAGVAWAADAGGRGKAVVTGPGENTVYDDGTGAKVCFYLPTREKRDGKDVEFTTFDLRVEKDGKYPLWVRLSGTVAEDGRFFGWVIIPSGMVDAAVIEMLGGSVNSNMGISKELKVKEFKKEKSEKIWMKGT